MYHDWEKNETYIIDIETDSLTPTRIWCLCWENARSGATGSCIGVESIQAFFDSTRGAFYVGHNILKFDAPVLNRLAGTRLGVGNCIDTLVLSTLYSPSISGGHSLEEWGVRLGTAKGSFDSFGELSPAMLEYCAQDVKVTGQLFKRLMKTLKRIDFSEQSIWIQHRFTVILDRQNRNGFYFNHDGAIELFTKLRSKQDELEGIIQNVFPAEIEELAHYQRAYKKDGSRSSGFIRHSETYERVTTEDDGTYRVYGRVPFNIGSPVQRADKLQSLGWVPREFSPAGGAKPFDKGKLSPSLEEFLEKNPVPEVELIARWMSVNGRANMINTWLDNYNHDTHCIHGSLFVADTLRLRHQTPNTANIPAVRTTKAGDVLLGEKGYYTYEARDLWTARPKRLLVGVDAKGLELRMLADRINNPAFTSQVIDGDPHQYNADVAGVDRSVAKTLLYAIQYGAQAGKVASIIGGTRQEGEALRTQFLDRLGLTGVMNDAIHEQEQGRVSLCDGSQVVCPSPHAALNYKLQGGGARVMARASIIVEGYIRQDGLDALKVGDIHDEWEYDVDPKDASQFSKRGVQAITEAGECLGLRVPLDANAKIGNTWAETH